MYVYSKEKVSNPQGRFVWKYQQKLLDASCVNSATDSEEEIGRKVAASMKQFEDRLFVTIQGSRCGAYDHQAAITILS